MSQVKNNNKKNMFKEGSNPLFPISNKSLNSLNYYSAVNINVKNKSNEHKKLLSNDIITNINHKKLIENSSGMKNIKEINKTYYSSSRPKEDNQLLKINNSKMSKIKPLDFTGNINNSQVFQKNNNNLNMRHKKSLLSANKTNNRTNINLEIDASKFFKDNHINIISPKNLGNSQIFNKNNRNNHNNIYSLRKPNVNNNIIQITNSNNNSYYNNIIINDNSSTNINTNLKLNNKNKPANNFYLQTDKNKIYTKSPKESNVKLIFTNTKIINNKKIYTHDGPVIVKKKESSSLPLTYTNPGGKKTTSSIDKNILNGEYKLHLKRQKKNSSNENNIINMNVNNFINIKKNLQNNTKKDMIRGPEDLHFYYIVVIQDGKKTEKQFEKD